MTKKTSSKMGLSFLQFQADFLGFYTEKENCLFVCLIVFFVVKLEATVKDQTAKAITSFWKLEDEVILKNFKTRKLFSMVFHVYQKQRNFWDTEQSRGLKRNWSDTFEKPKELSFFVRLDVRKLVKVCLGREWESYIEWEWRGSGKLEAEGMMASEVSIVGYSCEGVCDFLWGSAFSIYTLFLEGSSFFGSYDTQTRLSFIS